jgi:hypothetical protein
MTHPVQILATVLFAAAILHTFSVARFQAISHASESGTLRANIFHFLGEIEVIFGIWATVFVAAFAAIEGPDRAIAYVERVDFTEAVFVFVIMAVAATRAVQSLASHGINVTANFLSRFVPRLNHAEAFFAVTLILGPLLGSLITEPGAMTVCAILLRDRFYRGHISEHFKYKTLALLFVNISIGGVLTNFAAPPVVMVASIWQWDTPFMFLHFGWKALVAVVLNTVITLYFLRSDFAKLPKNAPTIAKAAPVPYVTTTIHILFIALVVYCGHHASVVLGLFILFLGFTTITAKDQNRIQIREALLVGFFLAGLVVLGKPQSWWISPLITSLSRFPLYFGATALTAFTDNAALTYLGAQVPALADTLKYALVAGAVTGGGLTVIANAPNPAGYGILNEYFGEGGIRPGRLFLAALIPTLIASFCLEVL